jgi:hypothetical protein
MSETKDSDLMGSDEGYTLDAEEFKQRLQKRRNKLLENPTVNSQPNSGDGNKKEYSVDDEYPMVEGEARTPEADEEDSNPNPSPLNE